MKTTPRVGAVNSYKDSMNRQILAMLEITYGRRRQQRLMQWMAEKNLGAIGFCGATNMGAIVPNMGALIGGSRPAGG